LSLHSLNTTTTMTLFACLGENKPLFCCWVKLKGNILVLYGPPAPVCWNEHLHLHAFYFNSCSICNPMRHCWSGIQGKGTFAVFSVISTSLNKLIHTHKINIFCFHLHTYIKVIQLDSTLYLHCTCTLFITLHITSLLDNLIAFHTFRLHCTPTLFTTHYYNIVKKYA